MKAFTCEYYKFIHYYVVHLFFTMKAVLKSKLSTFWHISEGTFYRKHIKFVGPLIFTMENKLVFFFFSINIEVFWKEGGKVGT